MQDVKLKQFPDQSFIDEISLLPLNESFYKAILKIRPKLGIKKENDLWDLKRPKDAKDWLQLYKSLSKYLEYVEPIARKCRLGKGKYKEAMIQTVLAFVIFDDPFVPWHFQEYSLSILPNIKVATNQNTKTIELSLEIHGDSKLTDVVKVLKDNWKVIQEEQKKISMTRIRPLLILQKQRGIHFLRSGLSPMEIYGTIPEDTPDSEQIQPATIYKEQERIDKRIAETYLDT